METATQSKKRTQRLKRVFALAKRHGIPAEELREMVVEWGFPRLSACSYQDLKAIEHQLGSWFQSRSTVDNRYASQAQLNYLQQLWINKSDAKSKPALEKYCLKRLGCSAPELLTKDQISRLIQGLNQWQTQTA